MALPLHFPLSISLAALDTLFEEARRCHPFEACGLLLGEGSTIATARPTANVAPDPARHFEIDPASLIAAYREARGRGLRSSAIFIPIPPALPVRRPPMRRWRRATGGSGPLSRMGTSGSGAMRHQGSNRFPTAWFGFKAKGKPYPARRDTTICSSGGSTPHHDHCFA
jgi:hypothetical protein